MRWTPLQCRDCEFFEASLGLPFRLKNFEAHIYTPAYYRQGAHLRLSGPDFQLRYIAAGLGRLREQALFALDGSCWPIHAGNRAAMIDIRSAEQAAEYLRFFCDFLEVFGNRYRLVDTFNANWRVEGVEGFQPWPLEIREAGAGLFHARSLVEVGLTLLDAEFAIDADGVVEMLGHRTIGQLVLQKSN